MKRDFYFFSKYLQKNLNSYFILVLILTSTFVCSQTISSTKTVTKNPNSCSLIDVELKIQGSNPVSRPLEAVLVIDVSGSMGNIIPGDTNTSMDYAQIAASNFINTFFTPANNPTGLNRVAIVTYSTTGILRQGLTSSSGQAGLQTIINGLIANGGTNIQDGIVKADNELITNGTYNCNTARSIILLTDGVANRTGTGGSTCTSGTGGTCIQSAITAATNAKTHTVSSVVYNTQIFSVGLFGGISGTDQTNAEYCLNNIQSGGSYFTESGANLSGIYTQIFTQLSWVAAQILGTPFNKETVSNDFNIVAGSISVSKGSFIQTGQIIDWNIDFLNVETITLKYQLTPKLNVCGDRIVSTTRHDYKNSSCVASFLNVTTPNYCVPCAPVLSGLPALTTISCPATPNFVTPTVINGCQSSTLTYVDVTTPGNCAGSYSVTRTWTASNICFSATASQTINVQDVTAPVIAALPPTSTINCPATPVFAQATATDACASAFTLTFVDVTTPGNCAGSYSVTRTWTAKDRCNNSSTASQTINVQDITAPVIAALPPTSTINCPATPVFAQATATDACASAFTLTFVDVTTPGNCAGSYSVTRTWTAKDSCNNSSTASQTINVQDITAPVIAALPPTSTINCPATPVFAQATATDACVSAFTLTFVDVTTPGSCAGSYSVTRTWTAKDSCNNSSTASQTINVQDITAPVLNNAPADLTVECSSVPAAAILTATDGCDLTPEITFSETRVDSSCGSEYVLTRTWTVTDDCGNYSSKSQIITVEDTTNPVFVGSLPADATVQCDNIPAPVVLTASDNCDNSVQVVYTQTIAGQDDACGSEYTITRNWSVTDCAGNNTSHTQIITVEDTTNPVFVGSLPANTTVSCDAIPTAPVITATDNCDAQATVVYTETFAGQNDGCASEYTITRKWSVTDCAGNNTSHTQIITVEDTTNPVLVGTLPQDATVSCDAIPTAPVITATDNCDAQATVVYTETFAGQNDGCGSEYTITRKWSVTDCAGNNTSHTQIITVEDTTNPVLVGTLPQDATVSCDAIPTAPVITATDNCDAQATVVYTETFAGQNDGCGSEYTITRKWSVTDCAGNNTSHTQIITVEDTTNPVFVGSLPANTTVSCDAVPTAPVITATDNCDAQVTVVYTETFAGQNDGCGSEYTITRKWSVTDCAGNNTSHTQIITVEDTTNPVFVGSLPADVTVQCDNVPAPVVLTASDNCDNSVQVVYTQTIAGQDDDCGSEYTITRNWSVTDCAGNNTSHTQIITVEDTTNPVFNTEGLPQDVTVQCDNVPAPAVLTASDNCDNSVQVVYTQTIAGQDDACGSEYTITRNWSVTDCAGNNTSHTQIITVEDTTNPVFVGSLPADVTVQCDNVPAPAVLTASDNCDNSVQVVYTQTIAGQDDACGSEYTITRNWSVTDCAGNNTSHTQIITVEDTTNPVFNTEGLPQDVTVQCDNVPAPVVLTASDNCDNSVQVVYTQTIAGQDDDCGSEYTITRNWSVTDCAGNNTSHTQIITVEDTTNPVFSTEGLPQDVTVQCDNVPAPVVLTASDNCDNSVQVVYTQTIAGQDDACGSEYTITRNWSVTDCAGNNTSHTQIITVEDTTNPVFSTEGLPQDVTVQCDNVPAPAVLTASDNCDNSVQVVYTQTIAGQDDACGSEYTITRNWSVTDCAGNNTSHTQIITVEDTTNPVFSTEGLPQDVTVQCDNVPAPAVLTASDNCDNSVQVVYTQTIAGQDDACGSEYTITRNWSVTDCAGNNTSHTQIITVEDTTNPVFSTEGLPQDVTVQCDNVPAPVVLTASDNCDNSVQVVYTQTIAGQDDDCGSEYTITRNWSVTDCAGNNTSHTQIITVEDTTNPVFNTEGLPQDVTVQCDNVPTPEVLTASDNCDNSVQVVYTQTIAGQDDACGSEYTITRNWSVTDCAGNNTSHTQIITVEDTTNPVFSTEGLPQDVTVQCDNVPAPAVLTASDNCDNNVSVIYSEVINQNEGGCASNYTIIRTWTATDCAQNSVTHSQVMTVIDNTAPVLVTPLDEVLNISCGEIPAKPELVFEDNCSTEVNVVYTTTNINQTEYTYTIIRLWVVTDSCGNSAEFTQTINVTIESPFSYVNGNLCTRDIPIDLFILIDDGVETDGVWSDVNNAGGLTGSTLDPSVLIPGFYVYRYTITNGNCPRIIEVYMTIDNECIVLPAPPVDPCNIANLRISKVVTPNNDSFNDFFKIGGLDGCKFTYDVKIFNRWGALVYENPNYQNNWNGYADGAISDSNLPAGTYYYTVNIVNSGFDVFNGYIYLGTKN